LLSEKIFTVKELTVDRSKKAFMECYFFVRTKKRQNKLSNIKSVLYFILFNLILLNKIN